MNTLGADTGVRRLAALLESSVNLTVSTNAEGGQKQSGYAYLFLR